MKTAIELLLNELEEYDFKVSPSIKKRYMEMEKQQIIDAYQAGDGDAYNLEQTELFAKSYYAETYGSES